MTKEDIINLINELDDFTFIFSEEVRATDTETIVESRSLTIYL